MCVTQSLMEMGKSSVTRRIYTFTIDNSTRDSKLNGVVTQHSHFLFSLPLSSLIGFSHWSIYTCVCGREQLRTSLHIFIRFTSPISSLNYKFMIMNMTGGGALLPCPDFSITIYIYLLNCLNEHTTYILL